MQPKETKVTTPTNSFYGRSSILLLHPESPTGIQSAPSRVCRPLSFPGRKTIRRGKGLCCSLHPSQNVLILIHLYINSGTYTFVNFFSCVSLIFVPICFEVVSPRVRFPQGK